MPSSCRSVFAAAALASVAACSAASPTTIQADAKESAAASVGVADRGGAGITPMCVEGCLDPDPAPEAVGYFLPGTENQFAFCAADDNDFDQDGLNDSCEYKLASTFRPEMSFALGDEVRREPRWAAQWLDGDNGTKTVRIAYLLSYWMDMGDSGTSNVLCGAFAITPPFSWFSDLEDCSGHVGDSEFIRLDVTYNDSTKHWFVSGALYSAHEWNVPFVLQSDSTLRTSYALDMLPARATMEYPDKVGGYPRAYAADRKHANYPTADYCDAHGGEKTIGGITVNVSSDECSVPRYTERIEVGTSSNLGSRHHAFLSCVTTQRLDHPNYGSSLTECYWSSAGTFNGWFNSSVGATPYGVTLYQHFGF